MFSYGQKMAASWVIEAFLGPINLYAGKFRCPGGVQSGVTLV
jgi:hypothetical protein